MNVASLRNYRAQVADVLKAELAELESKLRAAVDGLRLLDARAESDARRYLADAKSGLTTDEVMERYATMETLADAIRRTQALVAEARAQRDRKLAEVLEASREKRKLELIEQRQAKRARLTEERRGQQTLDEAAGRRFHRDRER
jgi:flagellar export protein FliJ